MEVEHTFNPSTQEEGRQISEFEESLVYIAMGSRIVRATEKLVLKNQNKPKSWDPFSMLVSTLNHTPGLNSINVFCLFVYFLRQGLMHPRG